MTTDPRQPTSFSLFKEFPRDIRILIWEAALPGLRERLVRIREKKMNLTCNPAEWGPQTSETFKSFFRDNPSYFVSMRSDIAPPQILFVNRESFQVASKLYERAFSREKEDSGDQGFYFSGALDMLYIRYHDFIYTKAFLDFLDQMEYLLHPMNGRVLGKDRSTVINLALLFDIEATSAIEEKNIDLAEQRAWRPRRPTEDPVEDYVVYEEIIASLLRYFGGIKHLTIIVKDYTANGDIDEPQLVDPLDIEEARRYLGDQWPPKCGGWPVAA